MRDALKVLIQLRDEGTLADLAIGGAIAASFYTPAVATEDLDIFAFLKPSASGLLVLTPLYERLKALGGRIHTLIESGHVQSEVLTSLVNRFALAQRWEIYVRRTT